MCDFKGTQLILDRELHGRLSRRQHSGQLQPRTSMSKDRNLSTATWALKDVSLPVGNSPGPWLDVWPHL